MAARRTGRLKGYIETRTYRGFRLEIRDDDGDGWSVAIYPTPGTAAQTMTLRNRVPSGLAILLAEAEARIDRQIDGPDQQLGM